MSGVRRSQRKGSDTMSASAMRAPGPFLLALEARAAWEFGATPDLLGLGCTENEPTQPRYDFIDSSAGKPRKTSM